MLVYIFACESFYGGLHGMYDEEGFVTEYCEGEVLN